MKTLAEWFRILGEGVDCLYVGQKLPTRVTVKNVRQAYGNIRLDIVSQETGATATVDAENVRVRTGDQWL